MRKISVKFAGAVVAFAFAVTASSASALTTQELINLLVSAGLVSADQVAALTGGSSTTGSSAACGVSTLSDMTIGSTNATVLQNFLIGAGHAIPAGATGYFGAQTKAALSAYQAANGISPAVGYFGPITRTNISTKCAVGDTTGGTTGSTTLKGTSGDIQSIEKMSDFSGEEVGEGEKEVEVLGIEIEAEDGSDLAIENVRLTFTNGTGSGSTRFDRYADEVVILFDGKEVGSADARDFSRTSSGVYTKTINLSKPVLNRGDKGELVVAISAIANLDSDDEGEEWNVEIDSLRYSDASGAVLTFAVDEDEDFTFESLATATDLELKIALDGTAKAKVVDINATTKKTGVELLAFTLEAKGSDLWVDEIPVTFATSGAALNSILSKVTMVIDGKSYNENVTAAGTITFDDLDFNLDKGDKVDVKILADINGVNSHAEGSTVTATLSATNRGNIVVEDSNGDNLASGDRTGTANGEAVAFYDNGIEVKFVSAKTSVTTVQSASDTATYTIEFDVKAFGNTMYVYDSASTTAATSNTKFTVSNAGTVTAVSGVLAKSDNNSTDEGDRFKIEDGKTARFTLTVAATATTTSGFHNVMLDSVAWTSSASDSTGTAYTFDLGSNAKTADLNLIAR